MKLVTYRNTAGNKRVGAVISKEKQDHVVDLNYAFAAYLQESCNDNRPSEHADWLVPADMRALFEGGDESLGAARQAVTFAQDCGGATSLDIGYRILYPMKDVKLCAPIKPTKLIHTAGNFREHIDELDQHGIEYKNKAPWIVFYQNVDAIIGPDEEIKYPTGLTNRLDYELELAVVLKGKSAHLDEKQAKNVIGGYVIFNDITARDIQMDELNNKVFSYCKSLETFCPLGPWIVTADEIDDPQNLKMTLRVNGEPRQVSSTNKMCRSIPEIISHYSGMGYSGGDVLTTGTVSGVAAFSGDPDAWYLKPGDVIECEIEKVGVLRNYVV